MYSSPTLFTMAASTATAFFLVATIMFAADPTLGDESGDPWAAPHSAAPGIVSTSESLDDPRTAAKARALRRLSYALSAVADGKLHIWSEPGLAVAGSIEPTASFKDINGLTCRHVIVGLTDGTTTATREGLACQLPDGRWRLDG